MAKGTAPVDVPKLFYYPPTEHGVRSAVIVLPGGGYVHEVMEKEGAAEARWLAARGVAAFVLQHRFRLGVPLPRCRCWTAPARCAMCGSHAAEYGVDPDKHRGVGILGVGGHLAGYLATAPLERDKASTDPVERVNAHPDFAVFSYARLSMESTVPRTGNLEALIGDRPTAGDGGTRSPRCGM